MRILIIGDSQAGNPGAAAKRALESMGHQATQVHNDGKSPIAYVNTPALWSQYTTLARSADVILLIFGHNSQAGSATRNALLRMKNSVRPPVWMSGPPQYPNADDQAIGAALRTQNQQIFGARYIDAWPYTPPSLPRDAPGWHLTPTAAQDWGTAMAHAVASGGSSLSFGKLVFAAAGAAAIAYTLKKRRRR